MGNYCSSGQQYQTAKVCRKVSVCSYTTTTSQVKPIQKMKKQSFQILKFLQSQKKNGTNVSYPNIKQIQVISELGKGGQSKIFQVIMKATGQNDQNQKTSFKKLFQSATAIKRINLNRQKHNMESLKISQKLLAQNQHPFLITGIFTYQSRGYLYSAMELAQGGDLTSFLEKWRGKGDAFRNLGEEGIRMVLAGIILGLQFIHNRKLIYCDLKTDNVLIDKQGYPILADFELMTDKERIYSNDFQGTITSMGPQIFTKQYVDKGIDLWALGILIFTVAYSQSPYMREEVEDQNFFSMCKSKQNNYQMKRKNISKQLMSLINALLKVNPQQRLGYRNMKQIKQHDFFKNFDWAGYKNKQIRNPLKEIVDRFPLKGIRRRNISQPDHKSLKLLHSLPDNEQQQSSLQKLKFSVS